MKSEGEEAVELSLERMKTTRSSGRHSKRSFFFLVCLNGALMLAFKLVEVCNGETNGKRGWRSLYWSLEKRKS